MDICGLSLRSRIDSGDHKDQLGKIVSLGESARLLLSSTPWYLLKKTLAESQVTLGTVIAQNQGVGVRWSS